MTPCIVHEKLASPAPAEEGKLTARHWLLLLVLASVQLTHYLDFVRIMPLVPTSGTGLHVGARDFGMLVSASSLAAFLAGLVLAPWLDRFDRKPTLLVLYAGFTLATAACALAPNYPLLLLSRFGAGACGGVAVSVVLTIAGDVFPSRRRATAMSVMTSAYSVASIASIPLGLRLAAGSPFGWRFPFAALAAGASLVLLLLWLGLPPIRHHLHQSRTGREAPIPLWAVMTRPSHLRAFAVAFLVVFYTMCVVPYLALILARNAGCGRQELELVYLVGGLAILVGTSAIGRLADRFSPRWVFCFLVLATLPPLGALTVLSPGASLVWVLLVSTAYLILSAGRMAPALALITATAEPRLRGRFMSLISAVQQFAAGTAPLVSGLIIHDPGPDLPLGDLPLLGLVSAALGIASALLIGNLRLSPPPG